MEINLAWFFLLLAMFHFFHFKHPGLNVIYLMLELAQEHVVDISRRTLDLFVCTL